MGMLVGCYALNRRQMAEPSHQGGALWGGLLTAAAVAALSFFALVATSPDSIPHVVAPERFEPQVGNCMQKRPFKPDLFWAMAALNFSAVIHEFRHEYF